MQKEYLPMAVLENSRTPGAQIHASIQVLRTLNTGIEILHVHAILASMIAKSAPERQLIPLIFFYKRPRILSMTQLV